MEEEPGIVRTIEGTLREEEEIFLCFLWALSSELDELRFDELGLRFVCSTDEAEEELEEEQDPILLSNGNKN